jgi:hypothetical protein
MTTVDVEISTTPAASDARNLFITFTADEIPWMKGYLIQPLRLQFS